MGMSLAKKVVVLMGGGVSGPWYLSGGITPANCIAAYQAIGAETIFAAYTNLINPGTYDCATTASSIKTPAFDTSYGWSFNGTDQAIHTGIVSPNDQSFSVIVRFSDQTGTGDKAVIGALNSAANTGTSIIADKTDKVRYRSGAYLDIATKVTTGVLAIAGNVAYRNGVAETGTITAGAAATLGYLTIGGTSYANNYTWFCNVKVQALAYYDTVLTAPQVAAVTAAMNALSASTPPINYLSTEYVSFLYSSSIEA